MRWNRIRKAGKWALVVATIAVLLVWPLSRWWAASLRLPGDYSLSLHTGCLWFTADAPPPVPEMRIPPGVYLIRNFMGEELGMFWRFTHVKGNLTEFVAVPLWSIVLLLVGGTVLVWRTEWRVALRRRRGACLTCGYDRRGLADLAVCHECGALPTK